jgi:hypothetical protein
MARILLVALAAATFAAAPSTAFAATGVLQIVTVGGGIVSASPGPLVLPPGCTNPIHARRDTLTSCAFTYQVGTPVRLDTAGYAPDEDAGGAGDTKGPPTTLSHWSDERCPGMGACNVVVTPDTQSIAATFTPQRVSVLIEDLMGTGTVTSMPDDGLIDYATEGLCSQSSYRCFGDFPLGTKELLDAAPATAAPTWAPTAVLGGLPMCDSPTPPPCEVTLDWPRWASVGFNMTPPNLDPGTIPAEVSVDFQIRKGGSGSGTVHSDSNAFNCGGQCSTDRKFGSRETLVADPDSGSRFDHWGSACGPAPRCSLAVGPVTAVTAYFERGSAGGGSSKQPAPSPRFSARVLRLSVTGHGRKRIISVRLRVNAPSTVRAVLLRGRRQVASKRFRLKAGTPLVRFRVPARTRAGTYRLRLTIKGSGQTRQLTRRVRLPR